MLRNIAGIVLFVLCSSVVSVTAAPTPVRIGYFANITHAQALYGRSTGIFAKQLNVPIDWKVFNAGPSAMEALLAGAIDICYVGPNPAVNAYLRSKGKALRIVAGAASGGAALVLAPHATINRVADLRGKRLASPEFGNTQDVALKSWLKSQKLLPGRDVHVLPTKNPDILTLFKQKEIAGAWVPEPWLTRLLREVNGRIYLDERTLWPEGKFPTAIVVVRTEFLQTNPDLVKRFLAGHVEATLAIKAATKDAAKVINTELSRTTKATMPQTLVDEAFSRLAITYEPLPAALLLSAQHAAELGMLPERSAVAVTDKLRDIYDLTLLRAVLQAKKLKALP